MTLPLVLFALCILNDQMKVLVAFFSGLCVILIILSFMHAVLPIFALAAMGLAGILMAQTARKNYSIEFVVLLPSFVILSAIAVYFVYGGMQLSISPWQLLEKHITEAVELNIKLYSRLPLKPEEIKSITDSKPSVILLFTRIFPALCVIAVLFTIWINALMGNKLLRKPGAILSQVFGIVRMESTELAGLDFYCRRRPEFRPAYPYQLFGNQHIPGCIFHLPSARSCYC